jgi:hypothetical protein
MTRRTTVITPTTQTDALYELPSQPFARRVVSASIYGFLIDAPYHNVLPELKITDVEGNVLMGVTPQIDVASTSGSPFLNFLFADLGGSNYNFSAPITNAQPTYISATIPTECNIPESNLFTVTAFGSLPGDTIPNLVLVTDDADEDFMT